MKKVFLGGTCNDSTWRDKLIPMLEIDYFNPVVDDWTPECQQREIEERENCDYCLYVITPEMKGFYSIAEVVDDSNKRPEKTIFCVLGDKIYPGTKLSFTFSNAQYKSLEAVKKMVKDNGASVFDNLQDVADYLNS